MLFADVSDIRLFVMESVVYEVAKDKNLNGIKENDGFGVLSTEESDIWVKLSSMTVLRCVKGVQNSR